MCPYSWVCASSEVGQIKHSNTFAVSAQFRVPEWPGNIRALEHRALQGLATAALLRNVFFIVDMFCWGFFVLVCVMSYEYRWQTQLLAQGLQLVQPKGITPWCSDTQRTSSAPCLCFGAVVEDDAQCTQGVLVLGLVGVCPA